MLERVDGPMWPLFFYGMCPQVPSAASTREVLWQVIHGRWPTKIDCPAITVFAAGGLVGRGQALYFPGGRPSRLLTAMMTRLAAADPINSPSWPRPHLNPARRIDRDRQRSVERTNVGRAVKAWLSSYRRRLLADVFAAAADPPRYTIITACRGVFSQESLSLSTRIVPLRFQAGGRRRRPNLGLVFCV